MEPAIDFEQAGGLDVARLERSLALKGNRIGEGRYYFSGGAQEHWVDLYTAQHPRCDCGDHLWRDRICKHILAAMSGLLPVERIVDRVLLSAGGACCATATHMSALYPAHRLPLSQVSNFTRRTCQVEPVSKPKPSVASRTACSRPRFGQFLC